MITNPTNEHREQARHVPDCAWQRTTSAECEYRATHHYCPHPEHACTCPPRTKPFVEHLDERMISADDVLGFLLAAEEGDAEDMTDRGVQASVRMLLEIAKRRKETGALYANGTTEQPPQRLYVRLTAIGGTISHIHDPRQAYGKNVPVYEYVPVSALSSRDAEIRKVLEGLATYRNPICWCPLNTEAEPHTEACRATTVLYAKLQPT